MHFDQLLRVAINSLKLTEPCKHHTHKHTHQRLILTPNLVNEHKIAEIKLYFNTRTTRNKTKSWFECFTSTRHWVCGWWQPDASSRQRETCMRYICYWSKHLNSGDAGIRKPMKRKSEMKTLKKQSPDNCETVWSISRIHDDVFWSTSNIISYYWKAGTAGKMISRHVKNLRSTLSDIISHLAWLRVLAKYAKCPH